MSVKVLMVEDDTLLSKLLGAELAKNGFELTSSMECGKGLDLARQIRPDIILLDYILPDMSAPELVAQLKADPALRSIPIIMLSNVGNKEEIQKLLDAGVNKFLVKYSVSLKQILQEIQTILQIKP